MFGRKDGTTVGCPECIDRRSTSAVAGICQENIRRCTVRVQFIAAVRFECPVTAHWWFFCLNVFFDVVWIVVWKASHSNIVVHVLVLTNAFDFTVCTKYLFSLT